MTEYLAEKLNLSVVRREKLAISSFGAADIVVKDMNVVWLRVKCLNNMGFGYPYYLLAIVKSTTKTSEVNI